MRVTLLFVFVLGCDEAPVLEEPADNLGYVVREGAPELECPGDEACVMGNGSDVWVSKRSWPHHYRLQGAESSVRGRVTASVARILEEEHTTLALGHCSLAAAAPALYSSSDGVVVGIPPSPVADARLAPTTPLVANAHLRSEYAFINIEEAESMAWFSDAELQRMTHGTFSDPRARHVSGSRLIDGRYRTLDLLVVFSPESERVYVLERSREVAAEVHRTEQETLRRDDAQALVRFVQNLGLARIRFDLAAACEIPPEFGGSEWMPLRLPTQTR